MPEEIDAKGELEQLRSRALDALASLILEDRPPSQLQEWRTRAEKALAEFKKFDTWLAQERTSERESSPRFGRGIDWILKVLREEGRALEHEELVRKVLEAGFAKGEGSDRYRRGRVTRSISMYESGIAGKRKSALRVVNGKVGLADWTDERFSA